MKKEDCEWHKVGYCLCSDDCAHAKSGCIINVSNPFPPPKGFLPREVPLGHALGYAQNSPSNVVLPAHYGRFKIEPIRFIVENKLDWFQGNIIKYTTRYDAKNGEEDLRKARRYNEMQIKFLAGDADWWK